MSGNIQLNVGWGFHPNKKNNEFQELTNCHPELVSGSSHQQKCSTICTQKTNVGLKAQLPFSLAERKRKQKESTMSRVIKNSKSRLEKY